MAQQRLEEDQPNDPNKENSVSPASALETFLKTYHTFISENQSVCIDLDRIVQDLNAQVSLLPPPKECPSRYQQLWRQGQSLNSQSLTTMSGKLKKMNDDKLLQTIINIEKLHSKLNMDYNTEINRSVELGLIQKKM